MINETKKSQDVAATSSIQRKAEAAALYLGHLQTNRITLPHQREAILQAKRNAKKWSAAAKQEFIKSKINAASV